VLRQPHFSFVIVPFVTVIAICCTHCFRERKLVPFSLSLNLSVIFHHCFLDSFLCVSFCAISKFSSHCVGPSVLLVFAFYSFSSFFSLVCLTALHIACVSLFVLLHTVESVVRVLAILIFLLASCVLYIPTYLFPLITTTPFLFPILYRIALR